MRLAIGCIVMLLLLGVSGEAHARRSAVPAVCGELQNLQELPVDPQERGVDPVYDAFLDADWAAKDCIVARISDATPMLDPRPPECGCRSAVFVVGDLAYILYLTLVGMEPETFVAPDAKRAIRERGYVGYEEWVRQGSNRKYLQQSVEYWEAKMLEESEP